MAVGDLQVSELFSPVEELIAELRAGRMIIVTDDADRENEGDFICAAEKITPEMVNFMVKHGRGLLCVLLPQRRCRELMLPPQLAENQATLGTAFTVSVDAHPRHGVSTGVSASDRATTIRLLAEESTTPGDLVRPGHISPIAAREGGVLVRAGHTEASVDLARLAGLKPAGVLIEIMNEDGTMARLPDLEKIARQYGLKMGTVASVIEYRQQREKLIQRMEAIPMPTRYGDFTLIAYKSLVDVEPHLAMCYGGIGALDEQGHTVVHEEPVLVRVHSECLTGDIFGSMRCDCGDQLQAAMERIVAEGKGAVIYLRQEGRGIGLMHKLQAYKLQDQGMDTVEANIHLGFPADKRDYGVGAQILHDLGLKRLRILTNNEKKVSRLKVYGIDVAEQIPLQIPSNPHNRRYLTTKKEKMGHQLADL
jgi:3,4-dihydroxy 2-butanone 4-phosphate synthase / GTP cyclohydrolase II